MLVIALGGCASTDQEFTTPTVTLPLRHAGITDARHKFYKFLAHELNSDQVASSLLHLNGFECPASDSRCAVRKTVDTEVQSAKRASTAVVLVPGIFYDCFGPPIVPFVSLSNAAEDGALDAALARLKESSTLASVTFPPIGGRMASADNASVIIRHLLSIAENPDITDIYVVAYSKGVADSMQALVELEAAGKLPAKVKAFVSLAGAVMGSDRADSGAPLYQFISAAFQGSTCKPSSSGKEVTDLTPRVRQAWLASNELPASIQMFSVAAYTSREKTHPLLRGSFDEILPVDPRNDGQVAASLALLPRSSLVALVNSDHWRFVLSLEEHPSWLVRSYFSGYKFPRKEFFRALIRFVQAESQ